MNKMRAGHMGKDSKPTCVEGRSARQWRGDEPVTENRKSTAVSFEALNKVFCQ
jgi:hypothetical protein